MSAPIYRDSFVVHIDSDGRRAGLFPGPDGGGPAQRKRLSRTGARVQSLVDEAAHTLNAGAAS